MNKHKKDKMFKSLGTSEVGEYLLEYLKEVLDNEMDVRKLEDSKEVDVKARILLGKLIEEKLIDPISINKSKKDKPIESYE